MTLLAWIVGATGIAILISAAAAALDASGLVRGRFGSATRWLWCAAVFTSVLLPLALLARVPSPTVLREAAAIANTLDVAPGSHLNAAIVVIALWVVLSLTAVVIFARTQLRLLSGRSLWQHRSIGGHSVLISSEFGPAVVGFLRPVVVIPRWVLEMSDRDRDMILLHEQEHLRSRDQLLVLVCSALAVAFPWNIALWQQLRRLKCAIELDCDARVVARAGDSVGYAEILLRAATLPLSAAGALSLAAPRTFAGIRIEKLIAPKSQSSFMRSSLVVLACASLVFSFSVPLPRLGIRPMAPMHSAALVLPDTALPSANDLAPLATPLSGADQIAVMDVAYAPSDSVAQVKGDEIAVHVVTSDSAYATSAFLERAGLDSLIDRVTDPATGEERAGGIRRSGMSDSAAAAFRRADSLHALMKYRLEVIRSGGGGTPRIVARPVPPSDTLPR